MLKKRLMIAAMALGLLAPGRAGAENRGPHPIVGVWELAPELMGDDPYARKIKAERITLVYEFTAQGQANISITSVGLTLVMSGTYKLIDESTLLLELDPKGERPRASQTMKYQVRGDRLDLVNQRGQLLIFTRK